MTAKRKQKNGVDVMVVVITIILVLLGTLGLLVGCAWICFSINPTFEPESHVTSYVGTIKDENGEDRHFVEIEYWENADGKGKEVVEISFNSYSGVDCTTVIKKVAQFYKSDDPNAEKPDVLTEPELAVASNIKNALDALIKSQSGLYAWNVKYYDKVGNAAWKSVDKIETTTPMYVTINNQLFSVQMDGTYQTSYDSINLLKSVGNGLKCLFTDWSGFGHKANFYDRHYETKNYKMEDFYAAIFEALSINNIAYGSNVCSLVDLAKFFTIKDGSSGQFVDIERNQEYAKEYFSVKVTRHAEGMRRASESNALMYADDANWTTVTTDNIYHDFVDYEHIVALDKFDFEYRYCEELGGYVAVLNDEFNGSDYKNATFKIDIDVRDEEFVLVGMLFEHAHDYYGINISSGQSKFYILATQELVGNVPNIIYMNENNELYTCEVFIYE